MVIWAIDANEIMSLFGNCSLKMVFLWTENCFSVNKFQVFSLVGKLLGNPNSNPKSSIIFFSSFILLELSSPTEICFQKQIKIKLS